MSLFIALPFCKVFWRKLLQSIKPLLNTSPFSLNIHSHLLPTFQIDPTNSVILSHFQKEKFLLYFKQKYNKPFSLTMASDELKVVYFGQPMSNPRKTIVAFLNSLKSCQPRCLLNEVFVSIKHVNKRKALKNNVCR